MEKLNYLIITNIVYAISCVSLDSTYLKHFPGCGLLCISCVHFRSLCFFMLIGLVFLLIVDQLLDFFWVTWSLESKKRLLQNPVSKHNIKPRLIHYLS